MKDSPAATFVGARVCLSDYCDTPALVPGPDGFMHYPLNPTDKAHWSPSPNTPVGPICAKCCCLAGARS